MNSETRQLSILFADVAGSTGLYERMGDQAARELLSRVINLLDRLTREHDGTVIKTIGDEIMCTFPEAHLAAEAAWGMQESLTSGAAGDDAPDIKVGFHHGPVIAESGDVYGDAVNVAARIVGEAKGRQIMTTGTTMEVLGDDYYDSARLIDRASVKGRDEVVEIFELLWEEDEDDVTVMPGSIGVGTGGGGSEEPRLRIEFQGQTLELGGDRRQITLGRGTGNDLVVADSRASRTHVILKFANGKFMVVDQSTNGTFVATEDGQHFPLRREEFPLFGQGFISLGHEVDKDDAHVVRFTCL